MDKDCGVCSKLAKYRCPKCFIYYCSVNCCKIHKEDSCEDKNLSNKNNKPQDSGNKSTLLHSTVPDDKLQLLEQDKEVRGLLENKHLRNILIFIDKADNIEAVMDEVMQEPIFVEFADACLRLVDPPSDD